MPDCSPFAGSQTVHTHTPMSAAAATPISPDATSTGAPTPPAADDVAEIIDKVISMGFQMEKKMKECDEEASMPGELGRMAERRAPRLRRKSKDLSEEFGKLMAPKLEEVFKQMDTDGSGTLDAEELQRAFAAVGRPSDPETIQNAIKSLDTDGDGLISLEEFKAIAWKCALG